MNYQIRLMLLSLIGSFAMGLLLFKFTNLNYVIGAIWKDLLGLIE